jgi:hypothetical protein
MPSARAQPPPSRAGRMLGGTAGRFRAGPPVGLFGWGCWCGLGITKVRSRHTPMLSGKPHDVLPCGPTYNLASELARANQQSNRKAFNILAGLAPR